MSNLLYSLVSLNYITNMYKGMFVNWAENSRLPEMHTSFAPVNNLWFSENVHIKIASVNLKKNTSWKGTYQLCRCMNDVKINSLPGSFENAFIIIIHSTFNLKHTRSRCDNDTADCWFVLFQSSYVFTIIKYLF